MDIEELTQVLADQMGLLGNLPKSPKKCIETTRSRVILPGCDGQTSKVRKTKKHIYPPLNEIVVCIPLVVKHIHVVSESSVDFCRREVKIHIGGESKSFRPQAM